MSAGFDAHRLDPLAELNVETEDFAWLTEKLLGLPGTGRVPALEGGYDLGALADFGRRARACADALDGEIAALDLVVGLEPSIESRWTIWPLSMTVAWLARPRQKCMFCSAISTVAPVPRSCRSSSPIRCDDDRRQPLARLVQQQQRRIAHQCARDRQHLLLAARQPPRDPRAQRLQQRKDVVDAPDRPFVLAVRAPSWRR